MTNILIALGLSVVVVVLVVLTARAYEQNRKRMGNSTCVCGHKGVFHEELRFNCKKCECDTMVPDKWKRW